MFRLIRTLVRPYRGTLLIILTAMLVQTAMSVAGPWPLKIILDNVVGSHKLAPWLDDLLRPILSGGSKMQIAAAAAIAAVLIAVLGAIASYIANYYTTSVGQWVANRSTCSWPPNPCPACRRLWFACSPPAQWKRASFAA